MRNDTLDAIILNWIHVKRPGQFCAIDEETLWRIIQDDLAVGNSIEEIKASCWRLGFVPQNNGRFTYIAFPEQTPNLSESKGNRRAPSGKIFNPWGRR